MPPFSHRSGVASRDIVPDEFVETMDARSSDDIDTVAEALRVAERQPSSTPTADRRRCPDCLSVKVAPRPDTGVSACGECSATFAAPLPSLADARWRRSSGLAENHYPDRSSSAGSTASISARTRYSSRNNSSG